MDEDLSQRLPLEQPVSDTVHMSPLPGHSQPSTAAQSEHDFDDDSIPPPAPPALPSAHEQVVSEVTRVSESQKVEATNLGAGVNQTEAKDEDSGGGEFGLSANTTGQATGDDDSQSKTAGSDLESGLDDGGSIDISNTTKSSMTTDDVKEGSSTTPAPHLEGRWRLKKKVKVVSKTVETSKSVATASTLSPATQTPEPLTKTNNNHTHSDTK